jgi:putative transposase
MLADLGLDRYGVTTGLQRQIRSLEDPYRSITNKEMSAVIGTYKEYPCSAVVLENILDKRYGIKIPHNRIHKILKNHRLASNDTNKQKRRKWVKYERRHSMSLWYTD